MTNLGSDDLYWRRPPEGSGTPTPGTATPGTATPGTATSGTATSVAKPGGYQGPPPTVPPPPDWRPRLLYQPQPPRELPPQDTTDLDEREREARTITYGVGMVAGAVLLVVLIILCGRTLF